MKKFVLKYTRVPPNPPLVFAKLMLNEARGCDEVVSIGGGSTIDVGKYIAFHLHIPHTAIPTTAGTGSEVTKFAVFTHNKKKFSLEDDRLIPTSYRLDPSRVVSLPLKQTASSGLDALSQAIESYWSPNATKESKEYSRQAVKRVLASLWFSYQYPKSELFRQHMLIAANFSGKAINIAKTSICHAISYPITTHYGVPHGLACALTLPFFMRHFKTDIASWVEVNSLIGSLRARIKINFNKDLIIKEALQSSRSKNVPKEITPQIIRASLFTNDLRATTHRTSKNN